MRIIEYKAAGLRDQLAAADPRLQVLVYFTAALVVERGWYQYVMVTSVKRAHVAGTPWSVHEVDPCRGCDIRTRGVFDDETAQRLEDMINNRFRYSATPGHNAAWFETQEKALARGRDPKREAVTPHLHLQVPPPIPGSGSIRLTL